MSDEVMIKIDNVTKEYILGQIGMTTLRDELQRKKAKLLRKEDPTKKIGVDNAISGESFLALDGVSFSVKKGERVGIIGHNGAGKSTLLKLISRVTAPTGGQIGLNGRVASMLEVGTGFHAELTGRENIYMNGAILGMTKREIDSKIEDIIDFSECRKFIDTPVKRYSSGMYVKLAFSVAAHLDSEIMIMDEVLAVGDVNFQQKCLNKMKSVAEEEDKVVLYVSHNMKTIRQLCNRCVVLDHGKVVFDGNVAEAIDSYYLHGTYETQKERDLSCIKRPPSCEQKCLMTKVYMNSTEIEQESEFEFQLELESSCEMEKCVLRCVVIDNDESTIGMSYSKAFTLKKGKNKKLFKFDCGQLAPGLYNMDIIVCQVKKDMQIKQDIVAKAVGFKVEETINYHHMLWNKQGWGSIKFGDIEVE